MDSVSVLPRLRWAFAAWLLLISSTTAAGASDLMVQQIGDPSGAIAEAVASEVTTVPFSPRLDARATPIILATGKAFVRQGRGQGNRFAGLRPAERRAIRQAYDAGQVILLLDASTHDIEALHVLLDDGVAHESSTDPVVLAYALRQENNIATARLVIHPPVEDDLASSQALEIVLAELTRPPAVPEGDDAAAGSSDDWADSPVQKFIITSTTNGTYNTPIELYALHSCQDNMDYYLVNTGGDWTATQAHYESAAWLQGEMRVDSQGNLTIDWQRHDGHCAGGFDVSNFGTDERICRYMNYPLFYEIDILPPSGPTVVQRNAAPPGDQGEGTDYESGFSFEIGGEVEVSGEGPSGGLHAGVSWDNTVSTSVPPLVIHAGDMGNEGTFTKYVYCTAGNTVENCTSTIQMVGAAGACQQFVVARRKTVRRRMAACPMSLRRSIGRSIPARILAARSTSRSPGRLSWRRARRICGRGSS